MQTDTDHPLCAHQRAAVIDRVADDVARASSLVATPLEIPPVYFDLKGTSAGMYCQRGGQQWLRFNPWLFAADIQLHLEDTVPHEVAHYAIHCAFPRRRLKPHGAEWKGLMVALGANPSATFQANLSGVPVRRQRRYPYRCGCREHAVSATRHNRMRRGHARYHCRYCNNPLQPAPTG